MRILPVLFVALLAPLAGCISVSGRVGVASGLDDLAEHLNAQRGTDFSGSVTTTGYGVGGEMYGMLGVQLARTTGEQTSTGTSGTPETLRIEQADTELNLAYPVYRGARFMLMPGLSLTARTTTLAYTQQGQRTAGDDELVMVLRPHLKALTSVGDRVVLSAGAGYDFGFLDDGLTGPGGVRVPAATPGPQANVTLTYFFCSGCVGG